MTDLSSASNYLHRGIISSSALADDHFERNRKYLSHDMNSPDQQQIMAGRDPKLDRSLPVSMEHLKREPALSLRRFSLPSNSSAFNIIGHRSMFELNSRVSPPSLNESFPPAKIGFGYFRDFVSSPRDVTLMESESSFHKLDSVSRSDINSSHQPSENINIPFNEYFERFRIEMAKSNGVDQVKTNHHPIKVTQNLGPTSENDDETDDVDTTTSPLNLKQQTPRESEQFEMEMDHGPEKQEGESDTDTDTDLKKETENVISDTPNLTSFTNMTSTISSPPSLSFLQQLRSQPSNVFFGLQSVHPPSLHSHLLSSSSAPHIYPHLSEAYNMTSQMSRPITNPGVLSLLGPNLQDGSSNLLTMLGSGVPGLPRGSQEQPHVGGVPGLGFYPAGFVGGGVPGGRRGSLDKPPAVKKYKCDVCDKAFSRSNTLVTHKRIHTGDKPFKCEQCGRAFRQPGNLTRHRLTHTTHKPYVCSQCGKAFNRASNLNTHMRTHASLRPFNCPICQHHFPHKNDLRVHMYSHRDQSPALSAMMRP